MAKTCYICGARLRNRKSPICAFGPCRLEHLRRHPTLRAELAKAETDAIDHGTMRVPIRYDDRLQIF